ncbi:MAG: Mo-dependent nitrogenase C-terminal domain-containing protein [Chroococcidiopsidaceae cyanobacterium CP_BM_ER_R8_30]|nr:Mo-dependent nitrogenase C-terminal domain-containing protein [Chroococcidiopsidaceae cyanobacterium CP_BM_ER_R8_30]
MVKLLRNLVGQWFNQIEVDNPEMAQFLCRVIPASCPFEREIKLFDYTLFHIPPLCKLNPFYEQIVDLRFKALSYLATASLTNASSLEIAMTDACSGDIALYC